MCMNVKQDQRQEGYETKLIEAVWVLLQLQITGLGNREVQDGSMWGKFTTHASMCQGNYNFMKMEENDNCNSTAREGMTTNYIIDVRHCFDGGISHLEKPIG
ncbi:hypothetical protein SUGI_0496980 [Cryptomeria japonica]|nr:hypothetical protein SUGI_0496980 [Cryptomeria japonica]